MTLHHEKLLQVSQNEAQAFPDKSQEGHGETKLDTEEAIKVDGSYDLETYQYILRNKPF